jgi:hypothetical protein
MARRKNGDAATGHPSEAAGTATAAHDDQPGGVPPEKTQPVHKIRIRHVTGAIWENARQDGSKYYNFTLSRSYRDEQNNWHSSSSFGVQDGFFLAEVARQCTLWIVNATQGEQQCPF